MKRVRERVKVFQYRLFFKISENGCWEYFGVVCSSDELCFAAVVACGEGLLLLR